MSKEQLILAVETSGRIGSVALASGDTLLSEKSFSGPMKHSAELFPAAIELLQNYNYSPQQINQIYISIGPGSFTGLRIAVAMAKAMNMANSVKIITVDTLDVIAENATKFAEQTKTSLEQIAAVIDAKRGQFYIAAYENKNHGWFKFMSDSLLTPQQFFEKINPAKKPVWLLGEGLLYHKQAFLLDGIKYIDKNFWIPKASSVYSLGYKKAAKGNFADPLTLKPAYLRRPEAEEKWEKRCQH
jgi:tRNA threonylcarbamoyladenosine biosynthesis protein TsaB